MKKKQSYVTPQVKEYLISPENAILQISIFPEVDIDPFFINSSQGDIYSAPLY